MKKENKKNNFKDKTDRIQEIITLFDVKEQSIENMILLYEEGMKLCDECRNFLETAEGKIIDISKSYLVEIKNDFED